MVYKHVWFWCKPTIATTFIIMFYFFRNGKAGDQKLNHLGLEGSLDKTEKEVNGVKVTEV